jgi:hypothetical protein
VRRTAEGAESFGPSSTDWQGNSMKIFVCSADDTERNKVEFCGNKDELLIFTERMRKAIEVDGVVEMRVSDELVSDVLVINATNITSSKTKHWEDIIIAVLILLASLTVAIILFVFLKR